MMSEEVDWIDLVAGKEAWSFIKIVNQQWQQGWGVIFWAGITGNQMICSFNVDDDDDDDDVMINAKNYCQFLDKMFFQGYKSQPRCF